MAHNTHDAYESLRFSLKGDITLPNEPGYRKAIARWALNAERNAQIIVFPKDASDVSLAIAHARLHSLELAIRGGGHSTGGSSSTEGMVIDLSRYIDVVEIDAGKRLAYVGGGCTWKQVDEAAIQHGLATVGGTVNHTGVGGLTLGGGIGWLSGAHGLVIDNLVEATVVTSDGSIRTANEAEEPDLWWAIRGGGCNFGVVTQFVLRLHPQRLTVYGGLLIYSPEKLEALYGLIEDWGMTITDKEAIWFAIGCDSISSTPEPAIILTMFYNGSEEEGRLNFKKFLDIVPMVDTTGEVPYEQMNGVQNSALEPGFGRLMRGAFRVESHLPSMKRVLQRIIELSNEEHRAIIGYEHISMDKISSVQNGACAHFRTRNANIFIITTWKNHSPKNLAYARKMTRELAEIVAEAQVKHLGPVNRGYGNYDQDTHQEGGTMVKDSAKLLFAENYPKLQALKKKYDPENVFSKWFPITPALVER